jgi:hypothetical protein
MDVAGTDSGLLPWGVKVHGIGAPKESRKKRDKKRGTGRSVHSHGGGRSQELSEGDRVACPLFYAFYCPAEAITFERFAK